eukprot:1928116-Rhodomonas_salina.2
MVVWRVERDAERESFGQDVRREEVREGQRRCEEEESKEGEAARGRGLLASAVRMSGAEEED